MTTGANLLFTNQDLVRPSGAVACKCRLVFGRRKFCADKYQQMPTGGQQSGGIFGGTASVLARTRNPDI
jgi:hypothetical protein